MLTSLDYEVLLPTFLSAMQRADIKVSVKDCVVKKCSEFADIFQGKTVTGVSAPVDPVVANCDLQGDTHLYQTIAIKRIRFDRTDENRGIISSL